MTDDSEKKLLNIPKEVANIIIAKCPPSQSLLAEIISDAVVRAAGDSDFSRMVACASKYGGNFLPRAAAILDVSPVTDVIQIVDENTYVRPMYAGNAIVKVKSQSGKPLQIISVWQTAFEKANTEDDTHQPETTVIELDGAENVKWLKENVSKSDCSDLGSASVVVSGGRGMGNGENFAILDNLADKLGGAGKALCLSYLCRSLSMPWVKLVAKKLNVTLFVINKTVFQSLLLSFYTDLFD